MGVKVLSVNQWGASGFSTWPLLFVSLGHSILLKELLLHRYILRFHPSTHFVSVATLKSGVCQGNKFNNVINVISSEPTALHCANYSRDILLSE